MGSDFKTYEGKRCGQCKIRLRVSGFCVHELERVEKSDPACKHFKEN